MSPDRKLSCRGHTPQVVALRVAHEAAGPQDPAFWGVSRAAPDAGTSLAPSEQEHLPRLSLCTERKTCPWLRLTQAEDARASPGCPAAMGPRLHQRPDVVRCPRCRRALWWPEPTPAGRSARSPERGRWGAPGAARSEGCWALGLPRGGQAGHGPKVCETLPCRLRAGRGQSPRVGRCSVTTRPAGGPCPVGLPSAPAGTLGSPVAVSRPSGERGALLRAVRARTTQPGCVTAPQLGLHCSRHADGSTPCESARESGFQAS